MSAALPTPPDVVRLASVTLTVRDLAASRAFWVDALGFHVERATDTHLCLRGYEEFVHHSLVLRAGPHPGCASLCFRVRSPADLARGAAWYAAAGCEVHEVPARPADGLGPIVRVVDPLGFTVELVHEMALVERLTQRYDVRRGASVARIDHANVVVTDIERARSLYASLGFGLSETIEDDDETLLAAWMYRKQSIHDIAFTQGDGPRLHHVGFAVPESHHVLDICDQLGARGLQRAIERGPGRHGVSNACYVYLRDPDGHRVELYTSDYFTGDPGHPTLRWSVHDPQRRDFWGNPVVPTWYSEASAVLDAAGKPVATVAQASRERTILVGADGFAASAPPGDSGPDDGGRPS